MSERRLRKNLWCFYSYVVHFLLPQIGAPSLECVGMTAPGQPDCPEDLEVTNVTTNSVALKWEVSLGVVSEEIFVLAWEVS